MQLHQKIFPRLSSQLRPSTSASRFQRLAFSSASSEPTYAGNGVVGIVREEYGMWERRSPLGPKQVSEIVHKHGMKVLIQPCNRRIYTDNEYAAAGATVTDDLSPASLLIGVKKIADKHIVSGKSYLFFSHVIKAQPANMKMLDAILERKARLFDYECITKGGLDDTLRTVAFGKFAGNAGMIDGMQGLGVRLIAEGFSNEFLTIPFSFMHENLSKAKETLKKVGENMSKNGFPKELSPIVFTFTGGSGNVATGAREIFEVFPHEYVTVKELKTLKDDIRSGKRSANKLYGVVCTIKDIVRHKSGKEVTDKKHYFANPKEYEPIFHEEVLPYTTVLVNGVYWDAKYPRLVTKEQIKALRAKGNKELRVVSDISCDIGGSVEFLEKSTTIEKPFFSYKPETGEVIDDVDGDSILMCGVDILPSELPRDSTEHFGSHLVPLLVPLLQAKPSTINKDGEVDISVLSPEMRRACIASHGKLLPKWSYISRLREQAQILKNTSTSVSPAVVNVELRGHLFDTGLINQVMDILEQEADKDDGVSFSIKSADVRPNKTSGAVPSRIMLGISGPSDGKKVQDIVDRISKHVQSHPSAQGKVDVKKDVPSTVDVKNMSRKRVILFGSGRVTKPVMRLFDKHDDVFITIASDDKKQAAELAACMRDGENRVSFTSFKFPDDLSRLPQLIRDCDVAISLLPATMHTPIAEEAIRQKRHLVTSSYVSPQMRALDGVAKAAGVLLVNEVGLDPGIDHMLIMKAVDSIHRRGGTVTELTSLCGGLPDPVAADNPLRYKISWSPRGVLNAAGNDAQYLAKGQVVRVPGSDLLLSGTPSTRFPTMRLEVLPNRDSLSYRDFYGVPDVTSICRGTLRYEGWSNAMYGLKSLGLLNTEVTNYKTWRSYMKDVMSKHGVSNVESLMVKAGVKDVKSAIEAVQWLGIVSADGLRGSDNALKKDSAIDSLCSLMEDRLSYTPNEKDMVAMFHNVVGRFPDGSTEHHTSRLLTFGVPGGDSAMAQTVGYTTAVAAEMILQGKFPSTMSGVIIPTNPAVYEPMLERLEQLGVTWNEDIYKFPSSN